jgi:adenine-specific DNA-methyltransferase
MPQEPRDYDRVELVWPGKRTEVERVRLPFQTIERVNDVRGSAASGAQGGLLTSASQLPEGWPEGWRNRLIWGDNKYVLTSLLDEFAGKVDLIYIDPPFETGTSFAIETQVGDLDVEKMPSAIEEVAYRDTLGESAYLQTLLERLTILRELLQPRGTIFLHLDWRMAHMARTLLDEVFGRDRFINEIIWAYKSMNTVRRFFPRKHDSIFWYGRGDNWTFNWDSPEVQIERTNQTYFTDDDGRHYWLKNGKRYYLKTTGKIPEDYWTDITSLHGPNQEQVGFRTQKPIGLLNRVIAAASNPGDLVLDAYVGSGTTAVSAEQLGRRWIAADIGRFGIQTARKRLLELPGCRPFDVLNLGRYERRYWQGLNASETVWEYYRFILDLYQAQSISGFTQLHGQKASRFVHIGATDAPVTLDEVARTLDECAANGLRAVDILGWEWEMGLNPAGKDDLARKHGVDVRLIHIPREVMDSRAVDAGDVHFFELSVASVSAEPSGREASVVLDDFLPAIDEYMRRKVGDKATKWSDWIDYWSVDFEHDGETYINQWQSYRTRKDPKLALRSAPHVYAAAGTYRIVVKVIDIFGNDTTQHLDVTVK